MPDLKIEFAVYRTVTDAEKDKLFKFRWMLVPPSAPPPPPGTPPPGREIHPTDPRIPSPDAIATLLLRPKGSNNTTSFDVPLDDSPTRVFSAFRLDNPDTPTNVERKRFTAKETRKELYDHYDPQTIENKARQSFTDLSARASLGGRSAAFTDDFIHDFCRIAGRKYRGRRTDAELTRGNQAMLSSAALSNSFVGQVGALLVKHGGTAGLTGGPTLAALAPVVADGIRPLQDGLSSVVVAIASGQQVDVFPDQVSPTPTEHVEIGELLGLQIRIDVTKQLGPEFFDQGTLLETEARLQYKMPDGSFLRSDPIADCFGKGALIQGGATGFPQPTATFVEDAYFDHLFEGTALTALHPSNPEFAFKPATGDGLAAFGVTGIADANAQYTSFVVIHRSDDGQPTAAEIAAAIKQTPVTPQSLSVLSDDLQPPKSPFQGGFRSLPLSAFHEFLLIDPTSGSNVPVDAATPEKFAQNGTTADKLAQNRVPAFGQIFYYWLVLKALGGDWHIEKPVPVQRATSSPLAVPDGVLNSDAEKKRGFPVLSSSLADGPHSASRPVGGAQVGEPGGLHLDATVGDPGRYQCSIVLFDEKIDNPAGTGDMPTYINAFDIEEFHTLLFRRVPKVKLDAPIANAAFDSLVEPEDLDYYRSRSWFRNLEGQGWTFFAFASAPAAGPIDASRKFTRALKNNDGSPLLLDSGWEYQTVTIAKRNRQRCYQTTASPFPMRRLEIVTDPANPSASPEVFPVNGAEPVRYLTEDGSLPGPGNPVLLLEYSEPTICPVLYAPTTKLPPAPPIAGLPPVVPGLDPIALTAFRTLPLEQVEGVRDTDLLAILSQSPTDGGAPLVSFKTAFVQGLLDRTIPAIAHPTGHEPGLSGVPRQAFEKWLQARIFLPDTNGVALSEPDRQGLAGSAVGVRGVVAASDPNLLRTAPPTVAGCPVVGVRWARGTRHEYAEFAPVVDWGRNADRLQTAERLPGLATTAAIGQPAFKAGTPMMLELDTPALTAVNGDLPFRRLLQGATADALRAGDTAIQNLLPGGAFPVSDGQHVFGSLHPASAYTLSGSKITFQRPLDITVAAADPSTYLVAVELLATPDSKDWMLFFADLPQGTTRIDELVLSLRQANVTPPASGQARIALVHEVPRLTCAYGNPSAPAEDFFDVVEADQEDTVVYGARLLSPGPQLGDGAASDIPPVVGPAGGIAFPYLSSVVPPTPHMTDVIAEPWNLRFKWEVNRKAPDGNLVRIYDKTNSLQFQLEFRAVADVFALDFARPLPVILAELRAGNWTSWTGLDGDAVKTWLSSRASAADLQQPASTDLTSYQVIISGEDVLSGQALLAPPGDVNALLTDLKDLRRRENYQTRYRVRALENFQPGGDLLSVLRSDWTPYSDWLTTLPLKPQFVNETPLAQPLPPQSPPVNQIAVTFLARNRQAKEFVGDGKTFPIFYRLVIRRLAASIFTGSFVPGGVAVTEAVLDHSTPTSDFPTLTFAPVYVDAAVAPASRVPRGFVYGYELEIHLCKWRRFPSNAELGGPKKPEDFTITSKSDVLHIALPPENSINIRGEEPPFETVHLNLTDDSEEKPDFWQALSDLGWERNPGKNIAVFRGAGRAAPLPFTPLLHQETEREQVLHVPPGASAFSLCVVEGGKLDATAVAIIPAAGARPKLFFA